MDITFLAPCKDLSGGIKVISIYANKLLERGHNITVVYPKKDIPLLRTIKRSTIKFLKNEKDHLDRFKGRLLQVEKIDEHSIPNADILIATAWETAEWANQLSGNKGRKFYFIQGYETWAGQKERVHTTLRYPFKKFTISNWLRDTISEISADTDIALIPNGSDFALNEDEAPVNKKVYDVGMTWSAIPNKGGDIGIETFRRLAKLNPATKFVVFGVEAPTDTLPTNCDIFVKPSQKKIAEIYQSTKVWMSTSYEEGFCLPCLEAMSSGCAVVSTDNKGVRDIVDDGINGFLVPPGSAGALTEKIDYLLNSPANYNKIHRNGLLKSKNFCWDKSADKLNKLISTDTPLTTTCSSTG